MLDKLFSVLNFLSPAQACVLMYHRVAKPPSDVWKIAVDPSNFEQHAQILQKKYRVVSLHELAAARAHKALKKNTVALTFDDGYVDNFLVAKPILDHYQLPATFFIASGGIDQPSEFWWDELEHIVLFTEALPPLFSSTIAGQATEFALGAEAQLSRALRQQHQRWDACTEAPPTQRAGLFLQLWQQLRPLAQAEQQLHLQHLRRWAGVAPSARPDYGSMSSAQLQSLGRGGLHTIGAHTVSHPALAFHAPAYQRRELVENRAFLEKILAKQVDLVAYPYGNYSRETMAVAAAAGFRVGFTTEPKAVRHQSDTYCLGRFQVANVPGPSFAQQLRQWQKKRN